MHTSPTIDTYFKRLDTWRHFPAYRLEPRVDVFFSLYLQEAFEYYFEDELRNLVIPEMPVSKSLLYVKDGYTGKDSIRVDFMLVSADLETVYLVELKTDEKSLRPRQDSDLSICSGLNLHDIIEALIHVVSKSEEKCKYMHLLCALYDNELIILPPQVVDLAYSDNSRGLTEALKGIEINPSTKHTKVQVVYVRPQTDDSCYTIDFEMLHAIVAKHDDPLSVAFAKHLLYWRNIAGAKRPACSDSNVILDQKGL